MQQMDPQSDLAGYRRQGALLVLYGGASCKVCHSLRPRLQALVDDRFPRLAAVYVDCEADPAACGQDGVFSVPVVRVYFDGQLGVELARSFSLADLAARIDRHYQRWLTALDSPRPD